MATRQKSMKEQEHHGMSGTPEYHAWQGMRARCQTKTNAAYQYYGGRGIKVHPLWNKSFQAFMDHVGKRPTPEHTLDRIDSNGNYEPGNVRWATRLVQSRNRRFVRIQKADGENLTIREVAERGGIPEMTLRSRLDRGIPLEQAKTKSVPRKNGNYLTYKGERKPLKTLAREQEIDPQTLRDRLKKGWSVEKALETPVAKKTKSPP